MKLEGIPTLGGVTVAVPEIAALDKLALELFAVDADDAVAHHDLVAG